MDFCNKQKSTFMLKTKWQKLPVYLDRIGLTTKCIQHVWIKSFLYNFQIIWELHFRFWVICSIIWFAAKLRLAVEYEVVAILCLSNTLWQTLVADNLHLWGCSSMELKNFLAMSSKIFWLKMKNFLAISWISELKNFSAHLLAQKFFG